MKSGQQTPHGVMATENNTDPNAPPSGTPALTLQISMPYTLVEFEKEKGLDANPRCPRHPSTAESENNSSMTYFEDLSGWSISKNVQVLRFQADDQNCLTSSPCNASRPSKFSLQHELNVTRNIPFNTPLSAEERESQQRSFIVFRMTVCRRTTYYVENVLTVIILLNIINVLSLLLSP